MKIKTKLKLLSFFTAISVSSVGGVGLYYGDTIADLYTAKLTSASLGESAIRLKLNELDFVTKKDMKYVDNFKSELSVFKGLHKEMVDVSSELHPDTQKEIVDELNRLSVLIDRYDDTFVRLVERQKELGLDPKSGAYGELRKKVHAIEGALESSSLEAAKVHMLQMRRNEKDFMLRSNLKYKQNFDSNFGGFIDSLKMLPEDKQGEAIALANDYQEAFHGLVENQQKVGLDRNSGLRGEINQIVHEADTLVNELLDSIKTASAESIQDIQQLAGMLILLLLASIMIASASISRKISFSVGALNDAVSKIHASNDLTVRAETPYADEIGETSLQLNQMLDSFQRLIKDVSSSVSSLNSTTAGLTDAAQRSREGAARQLSETDLFATASGQMETSIHEIAHSTGAVVQSAEKAQSNAATGFDEVSKAVHAMSDLSEMLISSEGYANELQEQSVAISSVLDVIKGVADQTNLLALNAAIEAARAGDAGRGFAVVADEVRSLAIRTQSSTEEITKIIDELQAKTASIAEVIHKSSTQGQETSMVAENAGELLNQIVSDVQAILDTSNSVSASVEEQAAVAKEMRQNASVIRDVSEDAAKLADSNAEQSDTIVENSVGLENAVNKFKV